MRIIIQLFIINFIILGSGNKTRVSKEGIRGWFPSTEVFEDLHGVAAAAHGQHGVAEPAAHGHHGRLVAQARVLERAEGVRGHHLGPLVGVVPGAVAASKDMAERAQEPIIRQGRHHRELRRQPLLHVEGRVAALLGGRVVAVMQLQVQLPKEQLPAHHHARVVGALRLQLLEELLGQRLAGLVVLGELVHGGLVVAPVLHELRGQLDGVPLHVIDAGRVRVGDAREHVLQAVAELVEQRLHLAEGHEGGLVAHGRGAVAGEVRHRQPAQHLALADTHIHPGAAALLGWARVGVQVERGDPLASLSIIDVPEGDVRVPGLRVPRGRRHNLHAEQPPGEPEHALLHGGQGEVWAQLLLLEGVLLLLLPLGPEAHVPQRQRALEPPRRRVLLELGQLPLGHGEALGPQQLRELVHRGHRGGHLGVQAHLGVGRVAQRPGHLLLEREDLADERRVVLLARGGALEEGPVDLLAGAAVPQVLHGRQVGGRVQGDHPGAGLSRLPV
mmetsp:Transcript_63646/g.146406  ORF Transcript_63646/g.146406 Transcript_63646/m.146406 type:complete len:501 (+) Transcript_63646:250-1752(+)